MGNLIRVGITPLLKDISDTRTNRSGTVRATAMILVPMSIARFDPSRPTQEQDPGITGSARNEPGGFVGLPPEVRPESGPERSFRVNSVALWSITIRRSPPVRLSWNTKHTPLFDAR